MATIFSDSFTAGDFTNLGTYSANWKKMSGYTTDLYIFQNRVRSTAGGGAFGYYNDSAAPPSADYAVSVDLYVASVVECYPGVCGRVQTGAATFYQLAYDTATTQWKLFKRISNTATLLATSATATLTAGSTYRLKLVMEGSSISGYVDGALVVGPVTDTSIASAGYPGIRVYYTAEPSNTASFHFDNLLSETLTAASAEAPGAALTATASIAAGAATGGGAAFAPGAALAATASLAAGAASGGTPAGSFVSSPMENNAGMLLSGVAVQWEWRQGAGIGVAPTSTTYGTGTTSGTGTLTASGLPAGSGELLVATADYSNVYYERGTVA